MLQNRHEIHFIVIVTVAVQFMALMAHYMGIINHVYVFP